ncbi:ABC transporter permease [Candidatus Puniceispirillum sp.]|jgi:ABC-2 type transport system permease protein|uniref:ABC transporter permease n=2 Tax=Candidatus Puniceispirillum TaxID=767891 RepID=UPI002FCE55C5
MNQTAKNKHKPDHTAPTSSDTFKVSDKMADSYIMRPVKIGKLNTIGLYTLYMREVRRFIKILMQTLIAPVMTSVLFLMVFVVAVGDRVNLADGVDFVTFLTPGLVMMNLLQNAFANTSSSLVVGKVQGTIVDVLMPPLGAGEVLAAMALAGVTRGMMVGVVTAVALLILGGGSLPNAPFTALLFMFLGALVMAFAGILAGIWANKFDEMAAITNFVIQPLAFLSGTFYSINRLPAPFDTIAALNPVFYAIDGFRFGMIGVADRPLITGVLCLVSLNLVLGIICYRALKSGYRLKS